VALLLLAHATVPGSFAVATVDHGLRADSADEAAMVAALCTGRGIAHTTLPIGMSPGAGVQARARAARYAAMAQWAAQHGLGAIVTAHHANDQVETLVMRLNRGAGVRGLAGMRAAGTVPGTTGLPLLRPLLGWRRAELAAVVAEAGIVAVDDPSNRDDRFERARLRHAMTSAQWLDINGLAASAAHLADADAAIGWSVDRAWTGLMDDGEGLTWCPDGPRAIRLRVLERIVATLGTSEPRGSEVARWLAALESAEVATLGGVRGDGSKAAWRFTRAPAHRNAR
jgi:tRNA(Ile)-lysidine synthase